MTVDSQKSANDFDTILLVNFSTSSSFLALSNVNFPSKFDRRLFDKIENSDVVLLPLFDKIRPTETEIDFQLS